MMITMPLIALCRQDKAGILGRFREQNQARLQIFFRLGIIFGQNSLLQKLNF
jgi:hypothetical protein